MKDALLMIGALSAVGKKIVFSKLEENDKISVILADTPARTLELTQFANEILSKYSNSDIVTISLDIRDFDTIEKNLSSVIELNYRIKYFIYLVGINKLKPAVAITEKLWDEIMDLNLKGFFFTVQYVGTTMMLNGGGNIVSIASQHGVAPNYDRAAYCSSKAALIRLSEVLALEWAKYKIRVNTVSPTFIVTEGNAHEILTAAFEQKCLNSIPLHRFALPDDVSEAVLFLLSDKAQLITGHNLVVDGGWLLNRS
jgi:NAD(P)-dependent dehydrogenase (short-subunit alcohol dehydrogenase family)